MEAKVDMGMLNMSKKKSGRRKARTDGEVCADRYSPVDIGRICVELGLIPIPENISVPGLVELWNSNTDYYLPRHENQGKELRTMSKPLSAREDERGMWVDLMGAENER